MIELYPAIDLRGGQCVRLYQGDYGRETVYGDDPVAQALAFEADPTVCSAPGGVTSAGIAGFIGLGSS